MAQRRHATALANAALRRERSGETPWRGGGWGRLLPELPLELPPELPESTVGSGSGSGR